MNKKEGSSTNSTPDDPLEVICILERGKKHNSNKIIHLQEELFFSHHQISRSRNSNS